MLTDDKKAMNVYMNRVTRDIFSYFDTGRHPSEQEAKRVEDDAIILEFKVHDSYEERALEETVQTAHAQIEKNSTKQRWLRRELVIDV